MGGPNRPRGRAEQCSRKGLCLEEGVGCVVVRRMVRAMRERVADGGGGGCRNCGEVSRDDLSGERWTRAILTQGQFDLLKQSRHSVIKLLSLRDNKVQNAFSLSGFEDNKC